ncbi:MAG: hypothetical protein L3J12_04020, partial [Spirochaetales bacterium]|nr:hypothetical protein [Spirochaetales bacterium]
MEKIPNKITISSTNKRIDDILKPGNPDNKYTYHFNQNEESFIKLTEEFIIPHFPIHHDSDLDIPKKDYLNSLEKLMKQIVPFTASIFSNLTYYFDKSEIFHPCFYRIYKYKEQRYLYLLRIDLTYKPSDC